MSESTDEKLESMSFLIHSIGAHMDRLINERRVAMARIAELEAKIAEYEAADAERNHRAYLNPKWSFHMSKRTFERIYRSDEVFTVRDLKLALESYDDDAEVWVSDRHGFTNELRLVWPLNQKDVLLEPTQEDEVD